MPVPLFRSFGCRQVGGRIGRWPSGPGVRRSFDLRAGALFYRTRNNLEEILARRFHFLVNSVENEVFQAFLFGAGTSTHRSRTGAFHGVYHL
jgi:hypothetical protein